MAPMIGLQETPTEVVSPVTKPPILMARTVSPVIEPLAPVIETMSPVIGLSTKVTAIVVQATKLPTLATQRTRPVI